MSLLSANDLTTMRGVLNESLPGTAVVQSGTFTSDAGGGGTQAWTASGTFDCRLAPRSGDEREIGDRTSSDADWVITLPALTSIEVDDRILTHGGTFSVVALRAPRSYEVSRRVEARELK